VKEENDRTRTAIIAEHETARTRLAAEHETTRKTMAEDSATVRKSIEAEHETSRMATAEEHRTTRDAAERAVRQVREERLATARQEQTRKLKQAGADFIAEFVLLGQLKAQVRGLKAESGAEPSKPMAPMSEAYGSGLLARLQERFAATMRIEAEIRMLLATDTGPQANTLRQQLDEASACVGERDVDPGKLGDVVRYLRNALVELLAVREASEKVIAGEVASGGKA
jgi:hypothetical protein